MTLLHYTHISSFLSYITFYPFLSFNSIRSIYTLCQKIDINYLKVNPYWLSICTIPPRWTWTSIFSVITLSIYTFNYIIYSLAHLCLPSSLCLLSFLDCHLCHSDREFLVSPTHVLSQALLTKSGTYGRSLFSISSGRTDHSCHSGWTSSTLIKVQLLLQQPVWSFSH